MNYETNNNNDSAEKVFLTLGKGQVIITGSAKEGKGAAIRPGKGVAIFINNQEVEKYGEVFPGDQIQIKPQEDLKPDYFEIKVSADQLKAAARYIPGKKTQYLIQDHPATDELIVDAVPHEEQYRSLTKPDLLGAIKAEGINYGLDEKMLDKVFEESDTWHDIAFGKPVKQSVNGWVEPLYAGGTKSVTYDDKEGRVDFRKRFEIVQVRTGDIIATIHPLYPGEPGVKVTGQEIQPDPASAADVQCENGAEFNSDHTQVIATRTGIPHYKKGRAHIFRVDNIYIHKGDVDIKSGNIDFRGHFKAIGGISEGMKITADGDIEIGDSTAGAEILAGGNVILKGNCIKCTVQAGWVNMLTDKIYDLADKMSESVSNALLASQEVAKELEKRGKHSEKMEAAVVRSLLQSKFGELPDYAMALMKAIKEAGQSLPDNITVIIKDVAPHFIDYQYSQSLSRPVLEEIANKLERLKEGREEKTEKADITVPYVQNSKLLCTGNIMIPGAGVYNSQIKSGGEVRIARLFRGGIINAEGDVFIGEAGSPRASSDQGQIQVPYKSRVHLGNIYENVRIRFGTTEYRCEKNLNNVRLILDQQEFEVKILPWEK